MIGKISVFRQSHVRLEADGSVVRVDPFSAESSPRDADFIFITHDHYDHFSPEDIEKTAKDSAVLIVPAKMEKKAAVCGRRTVTVVPGGSYCVDGIEFETVPAYNVRKPFHPKSAGWVGYIIRIGGKRVYIAGDTDATAEAEAVRCDVALVPIGGTYTMNAKEAAALVDRIKPEYAVPTHYGSIVGREEDGETFRDAVGPSVKVVLLKKSRRG